MKAPTIMRTIDSRRSIADAAGGAICNTFIDAVSKCQVKTSSLASVTCSSNQKTTYCDANDYFPLFVPIQVIHEARPHNAKFLNACQVTSIPYQECPTYVQEKFTPLIESAVQLIVDACVVRARSLCAGESQVYHYDGTIYPAMLHGNSGMTHQMRK